MTLGVSTTSIARLRALALLKADLARRTAELQAQGHGDGHAVRHLEQSLKDVEAETTKLQGTIAAARASQ